ncbi:sulfurtransferase complex subunit TusB [Buchnera aphidicola]|uniref:sulfurtransferase complex subunit TusB n=1 Tax=Buchnera aphidicola TaxID=9 RepID=UPI003464B024
MLHTLMNSPFKSNMVLLLDNLRKSDDFLALQDGVLIAVRKNYFLRDILNSSANLYVLQEDVEARGLSNKISTEFMMISYQKFVFLTEKNKQQMNW